MTNFPSASARVPDMFNLIVINKEIATIEDIVLTSRYNGLRDVIITDTVFTDSTINPDILLDTAVTGTADFATLTESAVSLGNELHYNSSIITFNANEIGASALTDVDTTSIITTGAGNLELGITPVLVPLTVGMTIDDVILAINTETDSSGVFASYALNGSTYDLILRKDNEVESTTLDIDASDAYILTDLNLTAGSFVCDIADVASQIGSEGSVAGVGPYNITLTNVAGVYIWGDQALAELGLTKTIDLSTDTITITAHGLVTGDQISFTTAGILPRPFNTFPDSIYFAIRATDDTIRIAATALDASIGTAIDITADGIGIFNIKDTTDAEIYYQVCFNFTSNAVYKQRLDEVKTYFEDKNYCFFAQTNEATGTTLQWNISW